MAKQVRHVLMVPLLSIAALLTTPATSAVAQGCTEQLAQDFLAGWSHDLPKLVPLFADKVSYHRQIPTETLHDWPGQPGPVVSRGGGLSWFD
jgi:hypothetical protein